MADEKKIDWDEKLILHIYPELIDWKPVFLFDDRLSHEQRRDRILHCKHQWREIHGGQGCLYCGIMRPDLQHLEWKK